ncbi:hypothetical protein C2E25_16450 [Geothermobacter hydrogeniphilus]|uniref:Uncharacterized protein n=1 Tax=Geothermobacter hydrogeniphilus TaxID=1969733 RepID=A0A2K2H601_9BACT|nr:hypothetical protein [Geothermobacter hydrogeniphilus]PNU18667.1 hypothetical protein C2E25_16450 [Geothermobacter hydrogeniphilus]
MGPEQKTPPTPLPMKFVLAPGCADVSEGMVCLDDENPPAGNPSPRPAATAGQPACEYQVYAEQQPGEGFWAVAPGCGDISEGMVWVAMVGNPAKVMEKR